jgi:hypothetical protein
MHVRHLAIFLGTAMLAPLVGSAVAPTVPAVGASVHRSAYVRAVLADRPSALFHGLKDITGRGPKGVQVGRRHVVRLPNGEPALRFDGHGQHLRFADRPAFRITTTGTLTIEYWMRPNTLQFRDTEGSGYVYLLGKGNDGRHEWYGRMYSRQNSEGRPNRVSGYAFNPVGGLGAGSYFQDRVRARRWMHVTLVINTRNRSARYPTGYTRIYKNGVLRDTDSLRSYRIVPRSSRAPLRVGTGYLNSFFEGAVGDVAFYNRELRASRVRAHYRAMY